ncbi:MAG: DUF58 domain-containing protein [Tepidisphaeraceae bacterium]
MASPLLTSDFMARLDRFDVMSRKILAGKMKGERRSKRRGQSVEFADFRNYVIGDDLRFIDWNIYARLDKLFLKLFLEEEDLALSILVDTSASMEFGTPNKLEYAKKLAAALGYVGLVNYNRVTIGAISDRVVADTGGMRGRRRLPQMLKFLEDLKPSGRTDFAAACKRFVLTHRNKGVLVLISDFLMKGGFQDGLRYLATGRYDFYGLQILSPQEKNPALQGDLRLVDVEDADEAEVTITQPLLQKYNDNLTAYCLALKDHITRRGGVHLFTTSDVPFETVVLNYLRERGLLG